MYPTVVERIRLTYGVHKLVAAGVLLDALQGVSVANGNRNYAQKRFVSSPYGRIALEEKDRPLHSSASEKLWRAFRVIWRRRTTWQMVMEYR